jgi:hypothetical protein
VLRDRVPEVAKPISRALHLPAVVSHGQVTLLERAKLGVELEGACLSITEKLSLEGKPHHAHGGIRSPHDVLEIPEMVLEIQDMVMLSRRRHAGSRARAECRRGRGRRERSGGERGKSGPSIERRRWRWSQGGRRSGS